MSDSYIGDMIGFSKITNGTPAAFCREVHGGGMSVVTNPKIIKAIGLQRVARKGLSIVKTSVVCTGVAVADWSLWIPGALGLVIAGFPDCLAEIDDGANGQEFVLSGGQPARLEINWSDAPDALVEFTLDAFWALATPVAAGTAAPVYLDDEAATDLIYGPGDISCTLDPGGDPGVCGIKLGIDLGTVARNTATIRTAGAKTFPDGYIVTGVTPDLDLATNEPINIGELADDEYTHRDVVITFNNGVTAADAVITLANMIIPDFELPFENEEGEIKFPHKIIAGNSADTWGTATVV